MRVVFLGKYYPPASGGIENHTQELARGLSQRGVDVRVVVVNHAKADGQDVTFDTFAQTETTQERDGRVEVIRVGRQLNVAKFDVCADLPRIIRQQQRWSPDIWHLHAPNVTMMAAISLSNDVRPLVISHHSDIIRQRVLKYAVRPLEELIYRRASLVLPTSLSYADESPLLKRFINKSVALPLGIDLRDYLSPSETAISYAEQLRCQYRAPLWLSVGRLIYYKGLEYGLEALRSTPGTWLIVGTGPLRDSLQARAAELGVADRVVWLGAAPREAVIGAYHAARALWFPSVARSEGFGLVQVEAMACGCPVINTSIPGSGVAWVSQHEVSGLTVPPKDASAFAAAARRLATEDDLHKRLAQGARCRAIQEFEARVMTDRCLNLYQRVLQGHDPH